MNGPAWIKAGMDQTTYRNLPWPEKRKILYEIGYIPWYRYHQPFRFITGKWTDLKIWWNRPPGGYLFAAYCKERAERHTIWSKFPGLRIDAYDERYR